jgi:hypothetical protein
VAYWKKKRAAVDNIHLDVLVGLDVAVVVMKNGQNWKDMGEIVVVVVVYARKKDEIGVVVGKKVGKNV